MANLQLLGARVVSLSSCNAFFQITNSNNNFFGGWIHGGMETDSYDKSFASNNEFILSYNRQLNDPSMSNKQQL